MLLAQYSSLVISHIKAKAGKDILVKQLSYLILIYIELKVSKNELHLPETQNELVSLLKKLIELNNNPLLPGLDLSAVVTQIKTVVQLGENELNDLQKMKNAQEILSIIQDQTQQKMFIENEYEKYAHAILFFGVEGLDMYFEKILTLSNNQSAELAICFNKCIQTSSNPNAKLLIKVLNLITEFKSVDSKIMTAKYDITCDGQKISIPMDAVATFIIPCLPILSPSAITFLLNKLLPKCKNKVNTINTILLIAAFEAKQAIVVKMLNTFSEANPFHEIREQSAFSLCYTLKDRKQILACVKEAALKNPMNVDNSNNFSITPLLDTASAYLVSLLIIYAIDVKDTELLNELVLLKQSWPNGNFPANIFKNIKQKATIEFTDPENTKEQLSIPNPPLSVLNVLIYAVLSNFPEGVKILMRDPGRYSYSQNTVAISRALREGYLDCLPPLLSVSYTAQQIAKERKKSSNRDTAVVPLALKYEIDIELFTKIFNRFSVDIRSRNSYYGTLNLKSHLHRKFLAMLIETEDNIVDIDSFIFACKRLAALDPSCLSLIEERLKALFPKIADDVLASIEASEMPKHIGTFLSCMSELLPASLDNYLNTTTKYSHMHSQTNVKDIQTQVDNNQKQAIKKYRYVPSEQKEIYKKLLRNIVNILLDISAKSNNKIDLNADAVDCVNTNNGKITEGYRIDSFTLAFIIGEFDIVKKMVALGAKVLEKHFCFAAYLGHANILQYIIDKQHDYYFSESADTKTPLEYAVLNKHKACVEVLVNSLLNDPVYGKEHQTCIRYIKKALKFCTLDQQDIRTFLESKLSMKEKEAAAERNAHRIEFEVDEMPVTDNEENSNSIKIEQISLRDRRIKFKNTELGKDAVAFIDNEHWAAVNKNPKHTDFIDVIQFYSDNTRRFGQRLFSVKKKFPDGVKSVIKFRGYGDVRLFFVPMTIDDVKEKYPNEVISEKLIYYRTVLQKKHEGKFTP